MDLAALALALEPQDRALAELRVANARAEAHREILARHLHGARALARDLARRRRGERDAVGGVQRPAHRDARADVLDRLGRQLREEPGRVAVGRAAENAPALRVREVEPLHRAREADVAEPALLGQPVGIEGGALRREQAFLEADDENGRELESFRRMQGHELHAVEAGRGLRLAGLERRVREEGVERREAFVVVRLESLGGVDELVEVLDARLALVVLLARVMVAQPRVLDHVLHLLMQRQLRDRGRQPVDQREEAAERRPRRARAVSGHSSWPARQRLRL